MLLLILGGVFLLGFSEAVVVAIPLVGVFLLLNAVVVAVGLYDVWSEPGTFSGWTDALTSGGGGVGAMLGPALLCSTEVGSGAGSKRRHTCAPLRLTKG